MTRIAFSPINMVVIITYEQNNVNSNYNYQKAFFPNTLQVRVVV